MLRVAVIQIGSILFRREATFERVSASIEDAARAGAELVVLPEALLGGYPKGLDFGVRIGSRSSAGREVFRRYWDGAIDIPGPETRALSELAAKRQIGIVIGAVAHAGSTLLCCTLLFPPDGAEPLVHNKLMPTAGERTIWGAGDGSTMPVMTIDRAVVGSAICWENYMPLFRTAMYARGVDIWCASTVDDRDTWLATMRHVALEGRCFVLSACQFLRRDGFPSDVHPVQGDRPETVLIGGGSVIVSPLGEIIEGPLRDREGALFAHLDLDDLTRARMDFDAVGHYARSDVFQLSVDEQPRRVLDSGQTGALE